VPDDDATAAATFDVTSDGAGTTTLAVGGEIDVATSPVLRRELHALIDDGEGTLVVDFSATSFIDSSGLGVLVGALKRLRETDRGDTLELAGLHDSVRKVFDITGLTDVFTIRG
jgi:anti-sigma B factor antagonist